MVKCVPNPQNLEKEDLEKENKIKIVRKSSENTTDTVSLGLGQLARASVVKSF